MSEGEGASQAPPEEPKQATPQSGPAPSAVTGGPSQVSHIVDPTIDTSVPVTSTHINVEQALLKITEDRLRLVLNEHLKRLETRRLWIAPMGILLSILVTLITTDFKQRGLDPATWRAIFIISAILTGGWLIWALWQAINAEGVEDVISKLRRPSQ